MIPRLISAGLIMVLIAANLGLHYYAVTRSGAVHTATVQARGESVYTPFRPLHTGASPAAVEVPEAPLSLSASPPDAAREAMADDEPIKLPADELNHDETHLLESDESTQFLFHVVLDGTPRGFFVLSVDGGVVRISQELRRSLDLPEEARSLEELHAYGDLQVNMAQQRINFDPDYRSPDSTPTTLPAKTLVADISSVDLVGSALYYQGEQRYLGSAWISGALGPADLDLRLRSNEDAKFSGSFRFDGPFVREIEVGDIQRQGLQDAVRITNRGSADRRPDESVDLFFPQGSKVDVFLNGDFLESFVARVQPETYRFDLRSGRQRYEFIATTEAGNVLREVVDRSQFVELSPGTTLYELASGRDQAGDRLYSLSTEVGLTPGANAFFDYQDTRWSTGLRLGSERGDLSLAKTSNGVSASGSLRFDYGYVAAQRSHTDTLSSTRLSAGLTRLPGQPRYSFRETRTAFNEAREHALAASVRGRTAGVSWFLTPRYRYLKNSAYPNRNTFDFQGLAIFGRSTLRAQFRHSQSVGQPHRHGARASIDHRFGWGRVSYTSSINCAESCSRPRHSFSLSAPTKYLTFTGTTSFAGTQGHSLRLSVSTSLTRNGISTAVRQAPYAIATIDACLDEDGNGHCDGETIDNVEVLIRGQKKRTPVHQAQLDPDLPGNITAIPPPGFMMSEKTTFSIERLRRGAVNYLTVPIVPIRTIEGVLPSSKDGVLVSVLVKGEVVAKQRTSFDGWYSFELPAPAAAEATLKTEFGTVIQL